MKTINTHITEKLQLNKKLADSHNQYYTIKPRTYRLLKALIEERVMFDGPNADLNDIDVSAITDMELLFNEVSDKIENIHIGKWNVSNVKNMRGMFERCKNFNCDLSNWDVSNVKDMENMFSRCEYFDCDLNNWDVSNVHDMARMFYKCSNFKGKGLENWKVNPGTRKYDMFENSYIEYKHNLPDWY